jgi:branched-chain amino acid transport system permease protein
MRAGRRGLVAALLPFAAIVPMLVPPFWTILLNYIGIYSLVAIGLVVLTGVGGLTSLGQAMFVGFGAYITAVLTTRYGLSPWLTLPIAVVVTGVIAMLIGFITLGLSGHYLAVATIAWNVSFFYIAANLDVLGRYDGLSGLPPIVVAGLSLANPVSFYYLVLIAVCLAIVATQNLLMSRVGRAIRALRGGSDVSRAFGIDIPRTKRAAFIYAAVLAAVAGWLYAHMQGSVNPTPFDVGMSIEYLLMIVVGGAGQVWGALAGAAIVTVLKDQLQTLLPKLIGQQGNFEAIVFGVALVALLQALPDGLFGLVKRIFRGGNSPVRIMYDDGDRAFPRVKRLIGSGQLLEVRNLKRNFGELIAVNDLNLVVNSKEIVAIIGPNGAGKSTAFNLMTGVDRASSGSVLFANREITRDAPQSIARLGIARTFQHVRLVPGMSLADNVALGAHLRGSAGTFRALVRLDRVEEGRYRAEAMRHLARVGLRELANQAATSLPLGKQRIAEIARALCLDPVLLFLDEPAAGLRHQEKVQLSSLLNTLRDEGVGILLVEHDMDFVMSLSDRIIVINFGSKLTEGSPDEVVRNPAVIEAYLGGAL